MFSFDEIALKLFARCFFFLVTRCCDRLCSDFRSLERGEAWTLDKGGSAGVCLSEAD